MEIYQESEDEEITQCDLCTYHNDVEEDFSEINNSEPEGLEEMEPTSDYTEHLSEWSNSEIIVVTNLK